ncbi:hypothetical protein LCGC14_1754820 [marine sediment metagenome]|uniref:Uncharacterized protein n=1 Tax=marine sediment metagenome TaxID=412755 RepID=A0A0F9JI05_9ZZZZ
MGWQDKLTERERYLMSLDSTQISFRDLEHFARSLAASRALVEAKNEALRHCRNVHRLAADIIAPAYRGTNNALDEAVGEADAALARTEADISMDEETARIYKEGLIAMHDERHPDGGGLHGG